MRKKVCLAASLGVVIIVVLFAASCSKQVTKTQMEPVAVPEPTPEQEVKRATPEMSEKKDELAGLFEEDRLREEAIKKEFVNENIHFAFERSVLSDRARRILKRKADYLSTNPDLMITIEGHCDDRGTDAYNNALGERRADSVKIFLVDLGINTNRLSTVSYGEKRPVAMGHNETSWAKNRRAQFVIN
jgi:peptidoglycan-associated lipoprotein